MSRLEVLAVLQDLDTQIDQLRHRRDSLPQRQSLAELDEREAAITARSDEIASALAELRREQRRHEDEVATLEEKAAKANDTMYDGTITSPKELTALGEEIESLGRRQGVVEESILEIMEQTDPLEVQQAACEQELADLGNERGRVTDALERDEADIDAELASVQSERNTVQADADDELVAIYDRHRASMSGRVAVGRLDGTTCTACRLELSAVEIDRIRHTDVDEPAYCEECGALVVR